MSFKELQILVQKWFFSLKYQAQLEMSACVWKWVKAGLCAHWFQLGKVNKAQNSGVCLKGLQSWFQQQLCHRWQFTWHLYFSLPGWADHSSYIANPCIRYIVNEWSVPWKQRVGKGRGRIVSGQTAISCRKVESTPMHEGYMKRDLT